MTTKMAGKWSTFFTIMCCVMHLNSATNLNCYLLEKVFPQCQCRAAIEEKGAVYSIVDCSSRGFTAVPKIHEPYEKTFYKLILRNNNITGLTNDSFRGLKIEQLDLSGNSLNSVENDTFLSMQNSLEGLEIDGDMSSLPPIHALKKLNVIQSLTMRNYNVPTLEAQHKFFLHFTHLKRLTLDRWNMFHIEGSAFVGLNNLQSLTLLNQKMENLPIDGLRDDPFDKLETLHISHTEIKRVSPLVFSNLSQLKNLDLSHNQIEELEAGCFSKVESTLETINLQNNLLNNDNGKLAGLSGMKALIKLDLSHNIFQKIPKMLNLGATKSLTLLLKSNEIHKVYNNDFSGYASNLKYLDLTKNYIRTMEYKSFDGVSQLNSLIINFQGGIDDTAVTIPSSLKNSASTLHNLDLSGQKVDPTSLWAVVRGLISLRSLNLNSAELSSVPDLVFENLIALENIDLSHNTITEITQKSLFGTQQLKRLNLEANNIQTIPPCLFHGFHSSVIIVTLGINPIKCDCEIKKFLQDVKSGRIEFDSSKEQPKCLDQQLLTSKQPENLDCKPTLEEKTCIEYESISTVPNTLQPVTDSEPPKLSLHILDVNFHTIKVSWSLTDSTNLLKYNFEVTSANKVQEFTRQNIKPTESVLEATGLPANTHVTVCVTAFFSDRSNIIACSVNKTLSNKDPGKENLNSESDSADTGIIVGCAVAGVALIGIVIAVVILLVLRKKPKQIPDNYAAPTQPRSFSKAELPSMSDDSRTFMKPKKNGKSPHPGNMQVVAISDGQTSPGARVGRVNMMFQEDGYEPMTNFKKVNKGSVYENDHGSLPPTPGQDIRPPSYPGGYYNQGFKEDKYDQIEVEI